VTLHLSDLDELAQRVRNNHSKDYLKEAIASYRAGAYRAALIATWISVCVDIIEKIRELSSSGDSAAKAFEDRINAINPNDPSSMLTFEREILDIACEELQLITTIEKSHLERLKDDRNVCAHPTFSIDGSQFSPVAELARAYIVQASNYLLIQVPVKGKVIIERLFELINEQSFPEDEEKAFTILSSDNYLGRARESSVRNLTIVLLKRLFRDEEGISPELLNRISASLGAIGRIYPQIYNEVVQNKLSLMLGQATDKQLKRAFPFLAKRNEAWGKIEDAIKIRMDGLLQNMSVDELISYKVTALATINQNINSTYQPIIKSLEVSDQSKLLSSTSSQIFREHVVRLFLGSRSFDSAEFRGINIVLPNSKYLTEEDIKRILNDAFDNEKWSINQILNAGGIDQFFAQFYVVTKSSLSSHSVIWKEFWDKASEKGHTYTSLREQMEADELIEKEPEAVQEEEDDSPPF
jgi:hypothetical protein